MKIVIVKGNGGMYSSPPLDDDIAEVRFEFQCSVIGPGETVFLMNIERVARKKGDDLLGSKHDPDVEFL